MILKHRPACREPLVRGHLRRKGLKTDDVEEVTQIVFAKLSQALPDFDLDKQRGRFRTWLWRVTCNALLDWLRSEQRRRKLEDAYAAHLAEQPPSDDSEPEDDWLKEHHRQVLLYALEQARATQSGENWASFNSGAFGCCSAAISWPSASHNRVVPSSLAVSRRAPSGE